LIWCKHGPLARRIIEIHSQNVLFDRDVTEVKLPFKASNFLAAKKAGACVRPCLYFSASINPQYIPLVR